MGGTPRDRLRWKEPLHSLEVELQHDYGLTVVCSRALVRRLGEFIETFVESEQGSRQAGQVSYSAVAVGQRQLQFPTDDNYSSPSTECVRP